MNREELVSKINAALAEEFEVEESEITPDADVKDTLQIDSLGLVDLVALLESDFGFKVQGSELAQVKTFGALYDFVAAKAA